MMGIFLFYIALAIFFIFAVLGLTYMIQNNNGFDDRGTFGDMFGFANAMFTGLLVTILLQRKDINIQREEILKQTEAIYVQNFESTYFQMISLYNKFIENVKNGNLQGRTYLGMISHNITNSVSSSKFSKGTIDLPETRNLYYIIYMNNSSEMEHHLRINMIEKYPVFEDLQLKHIIDPNIRNYYSQSVYK